jgi:hypothetical protein
LIQVRLTFNRLVWTKCVRNEKRPGFRAGDGHWPGRERTWLENARLPKTGLAWIAPVDRCAAALKRAMKGNGVAKTGEQPPQPARRCVDDAVVRAMIRAQLEAAAGIAIV